MKAPHKLHITVYILETLSLLTRNVIQGSVRSGGVGRGILEQMKSVTYDYMTEYFSNKWKTK